MRTMLRPGTRIRVPGNVIYRITGEPVGEGGGSILYPAQKLLPSEKGGYIGAPFSYALKECYPLSGKFRYVRSDHGEVVPESVDEEAYRYLERAKKAQVREGMAAGEVYHTAFRITPVLETYQEIELSSGEDAPFFPVRNTFSVMESLTAKGQSLKNCLRAQKHLTVLPAFRIIQQVLFAVREVHEAGYLHLDLQDGNVFLKGALDDDSGMVTLIDFGCARKKTDTGLEMEEDEIICWTPGFASPELVSGLASPNIVSGLASSGLESGFENAQRLGPQADIYSVGCILLLLLTGHRFSGRELREKDSQSFIPRFSLRKTKCPPHLVDKMQRILGEALKTDPAERYADADEMLRDVTEFLELLQPYKTPLSAMEYDAFICYKHEPRDIAAARALRNGLEHFRERGSDKKRRIGRVFMDEGELSSCADFGEEIRSVLEHSRWLVVICSAQTGNSVWVNDEIRTFLKYHDPAHILAVVTEGNPGEVYPQALSENGLNERTLLAADARGENEKQVVRKIREDAVFRIAAPILNTTYDNLKQRNRIYRIKRVSIAACAGLFAISLFLAYAAAKSRTIADQALAIEQEHREAIRNQALRLLEQSRRSYEQKDPLGSIELALEADHLLESVEEFLPDTVFCLARALGTYRTPIQAKETMTAQDVISVQEVLSDWNSETSETGDNLPAFFLTFDRKYLFTASSHQIVITNALTSETERVIPVPGEIRWFDERVLAEEEGFILAVTREGIYAYDYRDGDLSWSFLTKHPVLGIETDFTEHRIILADTGTLYDLDSESGREKGQITFSENIEDASFAVIEEDSGSSIYGGEVSESSIYDGEMSGSSIWETVDGNILFAWTVGSNVLTGGSVVKYYPGKLRLHLVLFDPEREAVLWENEREYMSLSNRIFYMEGTETGAMIIYGDICEIVDFETGKTLEKYETDAPVIQAWREGEEFHFVLENGSLLKIIPETGLMEGYDYYPDRLAGCCHIGNHYYVRRREENSWNPSSTVIRYEAEVFDTGYTSCDPDSEEVRDQKITRQDQTNVRMVEVDEDGEKVYLEGNALFLIRTGGETECLKTFDSRPLCLCYVEPSEKLLIALEDGAVICSHFSKDLLKIKGTSDKLSFSSKISWLQGVTTSAVWQMVDEETAVCLGDTYSYEIHLSDEEPGILSEMKDLLSYDREEDVFYFLEEASPGDARLGVIERYSKEEITRKAMMRFRAYFQTLEGR